MARLGVRLALLLVVLLLSSCSEDRATAPAPTLPSESLPGTYSGKFPCDGCAGIGTKLWLRRDGTFFFRQLYPGENDGEAMTVHNLGRWSTAKDPDVIELTGAGPSRKFMRQDQDTLVMQTDSTLDHRLTRNAEFSEFSETIRIAGIMRVQGDVVTFTECHSGLVAPVSKRGDYARFRHQYRGAGAHGKPLYAEFDGRFLWSEDGRAKALVVERFVTVKAKTGC